MLADFFTKALEGQKFHLFKNVLMGYSNISTLSENVSSIKERVERPVIKGNIIEDTVQESMSYADVTIVNGRTTAMKEGQSSSLMVGGKNE